MGRSGPKRDIPDLDSVLMKGKFDRLVKKASTDCDDGILSF